MFWRILPWLHCDFCLASFLVPNHLFWLSVGSRERKRVEQLPLVGSDLLGSRFDEVMPQEAKRLKTKDISLIGANSLAFHIGASPSRVNSTWGEPGATLGWVSIFQPCFQSRTLSHSILHKRSLSRPVVISTRLKNLNPGPEQGGVQPGAKLILGLKRG